MSGDFSLLEAFDSSFAELYHLDIVAKRIVFASGAATANLGYSVAELRALPLEAILPELESPTGTDAFLAALQERRTVDFETVARRKDGTTYRVGLRVELMQSEFGPLAFVMGIDLTRRKRDEEQIKLLSAAVESYIDGVLIVRPGRSPEEDGEILYVNEAFARQTGYRTNELIGERTTVLHGPKSDQSAVRAARARYQRGEPVKLDILMYRKDGSYFWSSQTMRAVREREGGPVSKVVITSRDSTEDVLREVALATQNEKLTTLTSVARALFGALDGRSLIDAAVRGAGVLTGGVATFFLALGDDRFVATHDLISYAGEPFADPFLTQAGNSPLPQLDGPKRRIASSIMGGTPESRYVLDVTVPDEAAASTADVFAVGALAQYVAVAVRNVDLYRELEARRASVAELSQLKTDLIAMLAHDFKSPLSAIVGFAEIIAETETVGDESRDFLKTIQTSALRLAQLATDTLALARLEQDEMALRLAPSDIVALVRSAAADQTAQRTIDVIVPDEPLIAQADGARLTQVFENLIGNAIKYSPGGEPVTVRLRRLDGEIEIAVMDRGIGIPEAERATVFSRFSRGSNARKLKITGTGFGLFLSKTIVEQHGGRIDVESVEGEWSSFVVHLPIGSPAPIAELPSALVVDEAGAVRSFLGHVLQAAKFDVRVVETSDAAIAALGERPYDVAVVELDAVAPDFFARLAPAARERVAFVAVGNFPGATPSDWDARVAKPFLVRDLEAAIDRALAVRSNGQPAP